MIPTWLLGKARDVSIRQSTVCDGKGLFAKRLITPGTTFEYGGRLWTAILKRTRPNVNEAVRAEQLNAYLWENDRGVWLTVFKAVESGTELFTWYGEGYTRDYRCVKGYEKAMREEIEWKLEWKRLSPLGSGIHSNIDLRHWQFRPHGRRIGPPQ